MTEQQTQNTQNDATQAIDSTTMAPEQIPALAPQTQAPQTQAAQQIAQQAAAHLQATHPVPQTVPAPEPVKLNMLAKQKKFTFKDAHGYEWKYLFQFPGIKQAWEMIDNARMENGMLSNTKLWEQYCDQVIVEPANLKIDDFNDRPGLVEVMNACDTFLTDSQE